MIGRGGEAPSGPGADRPPGPYAGALQEVLRSVASRVGRSSPPARPGRAPRPGAGGDRGQGPLWCIQRERDQSRTERADHRGVGRSRAAADRPQSQRLLSPPRLADPVSGRQHHAGDDTGGRARDLARVIIGDYEQEKIDAVYVVYNSSSPSSSRSSAWSASFR